jgi:hypothetical protein
MSALGQMTLIQHLVDPESLDTLVREGLDIACIPTEDLHKVYRFALDYFHHSGRTKAPSVGVLRAEYGDLLDDLDIDINEDPEDSVEWAIDDLKGSYIYKESQSFNKRFAASMSEAETAERVEVLAEHASELVALSMRLESHESKVDAREGMPEAMLRYEARALDREQVYGIRFGLPMIDNYTRGIHDGELAVLAAGPKTGKSYFLDMVALREWQAGRTSVLYTLENSVEMTLDRIACLATNVESREWQHGECSEEEIARVRGWIEEVQHSEAPLHIIQPEPGQRTVEAMVRQAQILDADSLLIDQLTFIEPKDERAPRHLQIREILHTLKAMISTGRGRIPCLIAHQINREGVKAADKVGYLEMYHMAEGSEVERTVDWAFGLYRSETERAAQQAKFQTLASRREDTRHFQLTWAIDTGFINVRSEITLSDG